MRREGCIPRASCTQICLADLPTQVFCSCTALILRSSQPDPPMGFHPWKSCLIILSSIVSVGLAMLSICKAWCGHGQMCESERDYQDLEQGSMASVPFLQTKGQNLDGQSEPPASVAQLASYPEKHSLGTNTREKEPSRPQLPSQRAMPGSALSSERSGPSQSFMTPREEEDIRCGIILEAASVPFQFNGVQHPKGALRVAKLIKDGVCEVWTRNVLLP